MTYLKSGLTLAMTAMLIASGCAVKPLPSPPGVESDRSPSPRSEDEGSLREGNVPGEGFNIQEDTTDANQNFKTFGNMNQPDERAPGEAPGDFIPDGPMIGDGDRSDKGNDFAGDPGENSKLRKNNKGNDFAGDPDEPSDRDGREDRGSGMNGREMAKKLKFKKTDSLTDIRFAFDKYDLSSAAKQTLNKNAKWLKENPNVRVEIQGHCDERGTNNYNLTLGQRRAQSTKDYLVSRGVDRSRLYTISYGEERPFCFDSTESCWTSNRRGHFQVAD